MESVNLTIKKRDISAKLEAINTEFHVNILPTELLVEDYSLSSALDLLAARIAEELNGEWNTAFIIQKISQHVKGTTYLSDDTLMEEIFAPRNRRASIKELGVKMGYPLERLLRPPRKIYGLCLVLLFLCIPSAIGISWFLSAIAALVLLLTLYYLDRNGTEFRSRTLIEFAEEIEWRRNMELLKANNHQNQDVLKSRLREILFS
jgi:hypothetical protein